MQFPELILALYEKFWSFYVKLQESHCLFSIFPEKILQIAKNVCFKSSNMSTIRSMSRLCLLGMRQSSKSSILTPLASRTMPKLTSMHRSMASKGNFFKIMQNYKINFGSSSWQRNWWFPQRRNQSWTAKSQTACGHLRICCQAGRCRIDFYQNSWQRKVSQKLVKTKCVKKCHHFFCLLLQNCHFLQCQPLGRQCRTWWWKSRSTGNAIIAQLWSWHC